MSTIQSASAVYLGGDGPVSSASLPASLDLLPAGQARLWEVHDSAGCGVKSDCGSWRWVTVLMREGGGGFEGGRGGVTVCLSVCLRALHEGMISHHATSS